MLQISNRGCSVPALGREYLKFGHSQKADGSDYAGAQEEANMRSIPMILAAFVVSGPAAAQSWE